MFVLATVTNEDLYIERYPYCQDSDSGSHQSDRPTLLIKCVHIYLLIWGIARELHRPFFLFSAWLKKCQICVLCHSIFHPESLVPPQCPLLHLIWQSGRERGGFSSRCRTFGQSVFGVLLAETREETVSQKSCSLASHGALLFVVGCHHQRAPSLLTLHLSSPETAGKKRKKEKKNREGKKIKVRCGFCPLSHQRPCQPPSTRPQPTQLVNK